MSTPWTPDKMITLKRATYVARKLFPEDFHEGDCLSEIGREGQPCTMCAAANTAWQGRIKQTRATLFGAFGHPDEEAQTEAETLAGEI